MSSAILQRLTPKTEGSVTNSSPDVAHRREVEWFRPSGTIEAGDWVCFDISKTDEDQALYVMTQPADAADALETNLIIGVCIKGTADMLPGDVAIPVCIAGYVEDAKISLSAGGGATVPAGTLLASGDLAGTAMGRGTYETTPIGILLEDAVWDGIVEVTADCIVIKNF